MSSGGEEGKKSRKAIRNKGKRAWKDPRVRSFVQFRFMSRRNRVAARQREAMRADIFNETPIVRSCVW